MNGKQHTVRGLCYGLFLLTAGLCLGWYCLDREVSWWILLVAAVLLTVGFRRLFPRTVRAHCYFLTTLLSLGLSAVGGAGLSCALWWFSIVLWNDMDRYPIEYPTSIMGGFLCLCVFVVLMRLYTAARTWSWRGALLDGLTAVLYLPSFFLLSLNLIEWVG